MHTITNSTANLLLTCTTNSVLLIVVVNYVFPSGNSLIKLDAGWKLFEMGEFCAVSVKDSFKDHHKSTIIMRTK